MHLIRPVIALIVTALVVGVGAPAPAVASEASGPVAQLGKKKKKRSCKGKKRRGAKKRSAAKKRRKGCKKKKQQQPQLPPAPPQQLGYQLASEGPLRVRTSPGLYPAFSSNVSDYVTRCDGTNPVSVSVTALGTLVVSVDGSAPRQGTFTTRVPLEGGQAFAFTVRGRSYSRTFYVRCLPADFPSWSYQRLGQPNNEFYLAEPSFRRGGGPITSDMLYSVAWDDRGVPIWWFQADARPLDSKVLSNGAIAFFDGPSGYEVHRLDGTLIETLNIVGGTTDNHDLQFLPNGNENHLLLEYRTRTGADQTDCTGSPSTTVRDAVIQEIDPEGNLVREWNSKDHIAPAETGRWCSTLMGPPYDIAHINSVEPADSGDSVIASFRNLDAVYKIDWDTGDIIWKLGGEPTSESLTVLNDNHGAYPFGGQHDARLQPDGTVTIHDNATLLGGRPPRAVRYEIDETAMTATLVEEVTDPEAMGAFCCGSARRSPSGAWVMSWGANSLITEFGQAGNRVFRLTLLDSLFSYRAFPVPPGQLTRSALRAGMDAQYPRP